MGSAIVAVLRDLDFTLGAAVDQHKIDRALDACYDAILTPENWSGALHQLARSLDAACAVFYPRNPDAHSGNPLNPGRPLSEMPTSPDYAELLEEYVRNKWYLNHYRAERGFPLLDSGHTVVVEHDLATDDERRKLRHYNELYLRFGYPGYAMVGFQAQGNRWCVPMCRATSQGHFTPEDASRLAMLAPHFARMIRLSEQFALRQATTELDLLDRLACAAVLLDWRNMVVRTNARADALLGTDLRVRRGMLVAQDPDSNRDLGRLLSGMRLSVSAAQRPAERVLVRRKDTGPLVIEAMPVTRLAADVFCRARTILVITDPTVRPRPSEEMLRAAFGLTSAEARLAAQLAGGERLADAADALGIAKETARAQLKVVFAKTQTHRQSELVLLLSNLRDRRLNPIG